MRLLKTERGVRTETLLGVAGAIAGFAAQNAAWAFIRQHAGQKLAPNSIAVITTKSGETYIFGDAPNAYLYPQQESKYSTLWHCAAGAAQNAGADPKKLPPVLDMFNHISRVVGTSEFGYPRVVTDHRPEFSVLQSIKTFWPVAHKIFHLPLPEAAGPKAQEEPLLNEEHWPLILGIVAGQFILQAKAVLDPTVAFTIVMENAIAASKIDGRQLFAAHQAQEKPTS